MLNPTLFKALQREFGPGGVRVVNEDQPMEAKYALRAFGRQQDRRRTLDEVVRSGEEYRVNCPECSDTRQRLYINHRWGVCDSRTGTRNLWLVNCWNSGCVSSWEVQRKLFDRIYGDPLRLGSPPPIQSPADPQRQTSGWVGRLPGPLWMLDDMALRAPRHPALDFVRDRFFDPVELGRKYQVGLCLETNLLPVRRRLVAPALLDGELLGWQARYVGKPPAGVQKWYTCPGFRASTTLYNFDRAIRRKTFVVVEGPADVWAFGSPAAAVFGKVLRRAQLELLHRRLAPGTPIVLLLDPVYDDQQELSRGKPHPIERTYQLLREHSRFRDLVLRVYLPEPYDPGALDRWYMRDYIRHCAKREGIQVDFGLQRREQHAIG